MNTKKLIIGTVVGGIVLFILGFVIYAILLESFFIAHTGSATGLIKTDMQFWPIILGNLSSAALLTYIFLKWANISTFSDGFSAGLIVGFLSTLGFDLVMYDTFNVSDLTGTLVDPIVFGIMSGIAGGVIGLVISKIK